MALRRPASSLKRPLLLVWGKPAGPGVGPSFALAFLSERMLGLVFSSGFINCADSFLSPSSGTLAKSATSARTYSCNTSTERTPNLKLEVLANEEQVGVLHHTSLRKDVLVCHAVS